MPDTVTVLEVVSAAHGGHTWLGLMAGSHSQAAALGEFDDRIARDGFARTCSLCPGACAVWRDFEARLGPSDNLFLRAREFFGKPILVITSIKTCREHLEHPSIRHKMVLLIRDGRAVLASHLRKYPATPAALRVRQWQATCRALEARLSALPARDRLVLHYESLVEDPDAHLRRVCGLLGVDYEPEMKAYWCRAHHFLGGNQGAQYFVKTHQRGGVADHGRPVDLEFYARQDPRRFRDKRWRTELCADDLRTFEALGGRRNRRYGYPRSQGVGSPVRVWARRARLALAHARDRIAARL